MIKKKCPSCARKIERSFAYCPYCGGSIKRAKNREDYGLLGKSDFEEFDDLKLPFGMERIISSLIKQLERSLGERKGHDGFQIKISTGFPSERKVLKEKSKVIKKKPITKEEFERRIHLPKIEASSKMKRLGDSIIYEIGVPGVKMIEDVVLTRLASGIEVRAYSDKVCYVKFIPVDTDVIRYYIKGEKLFLELRG